MNVRSANWIVGCLFSALTACADESSPEAQEPDATPEISVQEQGLQVPKDIGFRTIDCSLAEDINLKAAWEILYNLRFNGRQGFTNCINWAQLEEADCSHQLDRRASSTLSSRTNSLRWSVQT